MNVSIEYSGRVYERVTYRGWTVLAAPANVEDVVKAKAAVEDALSKKYLEGILDGDSQVHAGMNSRYVYVECHITVLECTNCGCVGHLAKDCSQKETAWRG